MGKTANFARPKGSGGKDHSKDAHFAVVHYAGDFDVVVVIVVVVVVVVVIVVVVVQQPWHYQQQRRQHELFPMYQQYITMT